MDQPINVPVLKFSKINGTSVVHAANPYGGSGGVHYASQPYGSVSTSEDAGDAPLTTVGVIQQSYMAYSFIACGSGLLLAVPSLGGSLSWGLLSCGSVITQTVILHVDLGQCRTEEQVKEEDYSCVAAALDEGLTKVTGPQVSGKIFDKETKEPLEGVDVKVFRSAGSFKSAWTSWENGDYHLGGYTEQGSFTATIEKKGYEPQNLTIAVTADRIKIVNKDTGASVLDKTYKYEGKFIQMNINFSLVPIPFSISGEVIDSIEATGISGARIRVHEVALIVKGKQLFDFSADTQGQFFFSPPATESILNVRVDAPGYLAQNLVLEIDANQAISARTEENNSQLSTYAGIIKLEKAGAFDGKWAGTSTADSAETADAFCFDASVSFNLIAGIMRNGAADFGVGSFVLDGNIKDDGNMTGFARNPENKVTFSGTALGESASGDWWDELGCKGKYTLNKVGTLEDIYKVLE
jgi:hypothetical protein